MDKETIYVAKIFFGGLLASMLYLAVAFHLNGVI